MLNCFREVKCKGGVWEEHVCKNPVKFSLNDGPEETGIRVGKYLVHARLDY